MRLAHGVAGAGGVPQSAVGLAVADIVERLVAEHDAERVELGLALQIGAPAGRQRRIEAAEVARDPGDVAAVAGAGEYHRAAVGAGLLDQGHDFGAVRQRGGVERGVARATHLHAGAAGEQPEQHHEELPHTLARDLQQPFDRDIGGGQRAVEIDDQGNCCRGGDRLFVLHARLARRAANCSAQRAAVSAASAISTGITGSR